MKNKNIKKIATSFFAMLIFSVCQAQSQKDSIHIDGKQIDKIEKMPMDTTHNKVPLTPFPPKDSIIIKSADDADPKFKEPKK